MTRGDHHGGGGSHEAHGHHGGPGGSNSESSFAYWYESVFGNAPQEHDEMEERFDNWYDSFMNEWFGGDDENGDRPGEGDADAQTGDEHDEEAKTKKFIAFSVIGGMLLLLALAVVLIGVVCCCKKKWKCGKTGRCGRGRRCGRNAMNRPTAPPPNMVITRHPKEIEAFATPYAVSIPVSNLPPVEGQHKMDAFKVEIAYNGVDAPLADPENPRNYIDVFSPPPAYEPGEEQPRY